MAEKEKDRQLEEEKRRSQQSVQSSREGQVTPEGAGGLPSGVLTPLLKRHQDLDNELKRRLNELESK